MKLDLTPKPYDVHHWEVVNEAGWPGYRMMPGALPPYLALKKVKQWINNQGWFVRVILVNGQRILIRKIK